MTLIFDFIASVIIGKFKNGVDCDITPTKAIELAGFVAFACKLSADYLLIDNTIPVEIIRGNNSVNLEMQNNSYKVVKITTCQ